MQLHRLSILALAAVASAAPSHAGDLRVNLSATVSTICTVTGMRAHDAEAGIVQVDASCNAATFQLVMGGELAALPIQSASTTDAQVSVRGNTVVVRPQRPGHFTFDVRYGVDLAELRSAVARIEAA